MLQAQDDGVTKAKNIGDILQYRFIVVFASPQVER